MTSIFEIIKLLVFVLALGMGVYTLVLAFYRVGQ